MDNSLVAADSKSTFKKQLSSVIDKRLKNKQAVSVKGFAEAYYEQYPLGELEGRRVSDIYGSCFAWWNYSQSLPENSSKVRVFNPNLEEDGWLCPHTVVCVLQRDMPFLVDSIRMEINSRNISIHSITSTVMNVLRDGEHTLQDVATIDRKVKASKGKTWGKEAFVYLEINLHSDESELQELRDCLSSVLEDVDSVVSDYKPMTAALKEASKNLSFVETGASEESVKESRAFLDWLCAGHFTLMGYSEYEFVEKDGQRTLQELEKKRLGLFRQSDRKARTLTIDDFNPGMARFHLTPQALAFSKSSVRSRVHRHAYSDYVVVKRYDAKGQVVGENRFLGLYTAPVYILSPTKIPLIRQKVEHVIERSNIDPGSYYGKVVRQVLETFPRDELLQSSSSELFETVMGVSQINERHMVRFFVRRDPYGKFVNCILYIPRDIFDSSVRQTIQELISEKINATECEFTTYFSESILARVHLVFKVDPDNLVDIDVKKLEANIVDISRTWGDHLLESLSDFHGEEKGHSLFKEYKDAFTSAYRESYEARTAVLDIDTISALSEKETMALSFYQPMGSQKNQLRFKVFNRSTPIELSEAIPVLEHLGLRVLGEHPYKIRCLNGERIWLHDFQLEFGLNAEVDVHAARANFQEAFMAIWQGKAESDAFNRLVLGARINWREVGVLRAYARYMKQTAFNFSQSYIANTLANHLEITRNIVALFKGMFDPRVNQFTKQDLQRIERLNSKIVESVDKVDNLNEDRIVRRYLDMLNATLRTNFYQADEKGNRKDYISLKFSPQQIPEVPEPRPMFEVFVYSPRMEGVHLRGGKVSRGGLRWSDRLQDYRTEVLGLVKAQQVKNAVIVPNGAKGGFVGKQFPKEGGREAFLAEGIECYKTFIRGLLDVTDNLIDGKVVPPNQVIRMDEDDPYLVVAADKGTATFSDIANELSSEYQHWLGDAFASGGSVGYDHKGMGITARGAWVSVQRHFKEMNLDVQKEDFTVIGIGDMAGDVFGNGMLMSEHIQLVAAFNHLHIFIDPNPEAKKSFVERKRLFETPRTNWADYNKKLISKGGAIFDRSAKSVTLTPEIKQRFGISKSKMTPTEFIHAILKAEVDLIWNGGIGTYVKATSETHADVGDKANDILRVNGNELRCKVFGEGGNLGVTQLGRIEFGLHGGAINTDFIDNAAGVDCSDHEVNIKILLNDVVTSGDMTGKQRNNLLEKMTDTVSDMVLSNNYRQTQAISIAEYQVNSRVGEYRRFMNSLESSGRLDRALEFLPDEDALLERQTQGKSLTRPELSVLISYAKVMLKEELADSDVPQDEYMMASVERAFPPVLRERFKSQMYNHILKNEIVATQVANDMVNNMGINFCLRLMEATGSTAGQVAKAYVTASEIYELESYWCNVEAQDFKIDAEVQIELMTMMSRRVRRAARWFLRNRRNHLAPAQEITQFGAPIKKLVKALPKILRGDPLEEWEAECLELTEKGVPKAIAQVATIPASMYAGMGMVEAANESGQPIVKVAEFHLALGEQLGLHWFASQIADVKVESYWQSMAREAFMDDLESQMRTLTVTLIRLAGTRYSVDEVISLWMAQHEVLVARWRSMINELQGAPGTDFAMFSVALRELLDLAQASVHCESFDAM